jgi:hypothetical protein
VKDWVEWHEAYDDPSSALSARLQRVQAQLAGAIDRIPPARSAWSASAPGRDMT